MLSPHLHISTVRTHSNLVATTNALAFSHHAVASTHLTQKEIESELSEVTTADWFPLGLQLGMELPTLKQLEQDHPHDDQQCMTKVVKWWCQNAPAEDTSWERLAQALEVIGGYTNVVQNLRMKMASMPKGYIYILNGTPIMT